MNDFAILRSVDVPAHIRQDELAAYTQRVISQVQQSGKSVPPLLIMHVSEPLAATAGVLKTGVIRHDVAAAPESSYYEIWLVGGAVFADYVLALQDIVQEIQGATPLFQAAQSATAQSTGQAENLRCNQRSPAETDGISGVR
jgi:hypothetical protein